MTGLLVAIRDATPGEVVGSEFYLHLVSGEDTDVVHPHLSGDVRQDLVPIFQLDPEHRVRERFGNRAFQHDGVVFGLGQNCLLDRWDSLPVSSLTGTR